jgi:hypothetical protein
LKGLQKDIKFQWISSHCGVVLSEMADYLLQKGTAISQMVTCKLSFHSAKLKTKISIGTYLSRNYNTESQQKTMEQNS